MFSLTRLSLRSVPRLTVGRRGYASETGALRLSFTLPHNVSRPYKERERKLRY